ncbi:hypothetical protein ACR2R6_20060 [Methylocaldum gracile subsp. desertum]|uniref:hypothetical protein n=1 Tax=Methylocaldum sp. GT1BW TaxID=3438964 RepID=UPI003DA0D4F1
MNGPQFDRIRGLFILASICLGPLAFASGPYSIGGGDQPSPSYHLGKAALHKKLICFPFSLAQSED